MMTKRFRLCARKESFEARRGGRCGAAFLSCTVQPKSERSRAMAEPSDYVPPKIWTWDQDSGARFANINLPDAGATHHIDLPVGRHPLQHSSLGTPNGVQVTGILEVMLEAGTSVAEHSASLIRIKKAPPYSTT